MLDFSHIPNVANGAEALFLNALGANDWQSIIKPRGKSHMEAILIGSGAGGAGGFSAAAATARGGSGGGGSGSITKIIIPTFHLPDLFFANIGPGGLGGIAGSAGVAGAQTFLSIQPNSTRANLIAQSANTVASGGGVGSASVVGSAGSAATAAVLASSGPFSCFGHFVSFAGIAGGTGGATAGGTGAAVAWGNGLPICGGAGGGRHNIS